MWTSILQRHFPSSNWKKYYSKIIFFSLSVFHGLKPSFLWDIGPAVTATQIFSFVEECKSLLKNKDRLLVVCIGANIFVANADRCLKALAFEKRKFIEIKKDGFSVVERTEDLGRMSALLEEKFLKCRACEIWDLSSTEIVCPPCLFGLLLNYPLVYYFDRDYPPFSVRLKVYEVYCRFKLDNVAGRFQEASHYFRKCLAIKPYFIRAEHNLENISNLVVERWHFKMLNDQHRNEAFREAILKKIRQGFHRVLDVGTGTGILSLFAAEGKAKEIYACDSSSVMIGIAQQVFRSNNVFNVELISKHSSELRIPGDIHDRVQLLVTETFDAGLLGEDILETLSHAWEHLLLPPHPRAGLAKPDEFGMVIPCGASLYVTGIELDEFANDFHLKQIHDFFGNCSVLRNSEDYDTHELSRAQFICLTGTERILEIRFNDPNAIAEVLEGKTIELTLKCRCSGRLDCFAIWFDLCLDEDIVLSTNPLSEDNAAWDQAVFPLARSTTVEENQEIAVTVTYSQKKLNVSLKDSFIDHPKFEASEDVIKVLNNKKLVKVLHRVSEQLSVTVSDTAAVLDCYPFPLFGLYFLIQRRGRCRDELICFVPTENDRQLVQHVAEKYGLEVDVMVKTETCFEACLRGKKFDVILLDLVEVNGDVKDGILLQLEYLKSLLKFGGLLLPQEAAVIGQFMYSNWLWQASSVISDSVTCGYNIAKYINMYQGRHFIDLDLKSIEYTACSQRFELFSLLSPLESIFEKMVLRSPDAAYANAMVYWIRIKFTETCEEILTDDDSSYHQAAILFPKTELPEKIKFNVIRSDGLFSIELLT